VWRWGDTEGEPEETRGLVDEMEGSTGREWKEGDAARGEMGGRRADQDRRKIACDDCEVFLTCHIPR